MSSDYPEELKYTREHEWARVEGNIVTIGITKYACEQLGDITQIELPKEGETVRKNDVFGSVESVKAVSDIYSPVSGRITKVNTPLTDTPEYLADDPYDDGWMVQIEASSPEELTELMDVKAYKEFVEEQEAE